MKKQLLIQTFILFFISASAQNFEWARAIGGQMSDNGISIAVDPGGNVYTLGAFSGKVDFDPGPDSNFLISSIYYESIFISKLDSYGNFVWAQAISGNAVSIYGLSIAVDTLGNVYATGYFFGIVDFDPGPDTFNLKTQNGDMFILKLDSSGNLIWGKDIGGTDFVWGNAIALDNSGSIYITGSYTGTTDFNPGARIYNLTSSNMSRDIFILKLGPAGNFIWAKSIGGQYDYDQGFSITIDALGHVYSIGNYAGTVDFDPGPGTYYLTPMPYQTSIDIFISKLDASGNFMWARRMGGNDFDEGHSIVADKAGNIYATGRFKGTADFGPFNLMTFGGALFNVKLDSLGNFKWAKSVGVNSSPSVSGQSLAVDISGNVYTAGLFHGTAVDFDPGEGIYYLTSSSYLLDIFITELDSAGNFIFAQCIGGVGDDSGNSICLDASANIYVTGYFIDTVDFCFGAGTSELAAARDNDAFILKLDNVFTRINTISGQDQYTVFPNPATTHINVVSDATLVGLSYYIHNLLGKTVLQGKLDSENTVIQLEGLSGGMYILTCGDNTKQTYKVIKQ